jgi:flavin reductase (DIM6/NTAB) family NADH-FMN oxidoreductase RutF
MDVELKKQVLRKLTYGMWVLATGKDDDIEASSVTWLTQMSFAPPLLAVAIKADSRLAAVLERHRAFALHLLDKDQKDLASAFIKPTHVADGKVAGVAYRQGPTTGSPLLDGFAAWLEACGKHRGRTVHAGAGRLVVRRIAKSRYRRGRRCIQ